MVKENKVMYALVTDKETNYNNYDKAVIVKINYTVGKLEKNIVSKICNLDTKARKVGREYLGLKRAYSVLIGEDKLEKLIDKYNMIEI